MNWNLNAKSKQHIAFLYDQLLQTTTIVLVLATVSWCSTLSRRETVLVAEPLVHQVFRRQVSIVGCAITFALRGG